MENNLLKKMYFKPGFTVLLANAPNNIDEILGDTKEVNFTSDPAQSFDGLLLFVKNSTELGNGLEIWGPRINIKHIVWIAYPKKSSGIATDLKMEQWKELEVYQLTPCGSAAIDETWTGLRIKPVGDVKRSGVGSAEIKTGAYGEFIDVDNKQVTPPADLKALLETIPQAAAFFNSLAYTHKKEYVLWILTAKQEATRNNRLQKTIDMLLAGKKNPTMK
jgi:bacteriocin resistance YdeI/OmpD-like protein